MTYSRSFGALWNPVLGITGDVFLGVGRLAEARAQFWRDAEVAEANGDSDGLAVAALGLGGIWVHEHRSTLEQAWVESLQRHALAGLDPEQLVGPPDRGRG